MSEMPGKNPYAAAADAYGATAAATDPRALEGKVLLKAAQKLEDLARRLRDGEAVHFTEVGEILEYNQKLWTLFIDDATNPDHLLPTDIKSNIATLALYVFKRTQDILIDTRPEKFKVLVDINRNIAAGLMKKSAAPAAPPLPPSTADRTDSKA